MICGTGQPTNACGCAPSSFVRAPYPGDGDLIFGHVCKLGLEGLICERTDVQRSRSNSALAEHTGPPMDLDNMRQNGVHSLWVDCLKCHYEATVSVADRQGISMCRPSGAG